MYLCINTAIKLAHNLASNQESESSFLDGSEMVDQGCNMELTYAFVTLVTDTLKVLFLFVSVNSIFYARCHKA